MPKSIAALIAVVTLTLMLAIPTQARAEVQYPWCAIGGGQGGGTNCGFTSREQCMAAASGAGATCDRNPAYVAEKKPPKKTAKPRR